ncbi:MAG: hypothetical protein IIX22_03520, partial [Ruminococcus sp.]|nr:hypothetical protein [Ruminococcus sp.]
DPVASIVVDEPAQKVDGVAYYSGEFKGHITVDEANFVGDLLYKDLKLEIQEDDLQDTKYDYELIRKPRHGIIMVRTISGPTASLSRRKEDTAISSITGIPPIMRRQS